MLNKEKNITTGNAYTDNQKQWILGNFISPEKGLLHDHNIEVKWAFIKAGEKKGKWTKSVCAKTLSILIKGKFIIRVEDTENVLEKEGDYLLYGNELAHTWEAIDDSVVLAIRWPSVSGEEIEVKK